MQIGQLSEKVIIRKPGTNVSDDSGEVVQQYDEVVVWAGMKWKDGGEKIEANERTATRNLYFTIRYRGDVDERCEIIHEGKTYNIKTVERIGRKVGLNLLSYYKDNG